MPDIKEKPTGGKPKAKDAAMLAPKQAAHLMVEKYRRQLDQRVPGEDNEREYATGQVEGEAHRIIDGAANLVEHGAAKVRREFAKEKISGQTGDRAQPSAEHPRAEPPHSEPGAQPPANPPKERKPPGEPPTPTATAPRERAALTVKERQTDNIPKERPQDARALKSARPPIAEKPQPAQTRASIAKPGQPPVQFFLNNRRRVSNPLNPPMPHVGRQSMQKVPATHKPPVEISTGGVTMPERHPSQAKERTRIAATVKEQTSTTTTVKEHTRTAASVKTRQSVRGATKPSTRVPKPRPAIPSAPARQAARKARQAVQHQATRRMTTQAAKAAKTAALTVKRLAVAVVKAVAAAIGAVAGFVGGGVLLVVLLIVIVIAAVANSPFGLFFAAEKNAPDTVSVAEAVAQVNMAYNAKLEALQAGDYDSIVIHGQAPDWPDVLAVFAVKLSGADAGGLDVATLDADRVGKLTTVFWDMTAITTEVEEIDHPGDPGWTEYILHITITASTADDMRTVYHFTPYQNSALDELLADRAALSSLAGSLTITNADANDVLNALPDDLSPERREAVRTALRLVGKVNYFWGGKSYVIGWDSRWGQLTEVTSAGSSTTGTYRPYGLDCTGYLDWTFRNAGLHSDGHWYIGTNLTALTWDEAQPGDIALFTDDSHVGLVVGRNADGKVLVAHCSASRNNVSVTEAQATGFTKVGTPGIYP